MLYIVYPFIYFYFSDAIFFSPHSPLVPDEESLHVFFQHEWDTAWSLQLRFIHRQRAMSCLFSGAESSSGAVTRSACSPEWCPPPVPRYSDVIQPLQQSCGGQWREGSAQPITYFMLMAYSVHSLLLWRTRKVLLSRSESSNSAWHLSIGPANLDRTRKGLIKENRRSRAWDQTVNATANNINNYYDTNNDRF